MRSFFIIIPFVILRGCLNPQEFHSEQLTTKYVMPEETFLETKDGNGILDTLIICKVEIEAKIDAAQWKEYLEKNLQPDSLVLDTIPPGEYKALIRFIIDRDGKIAVAEIGIDPGYGLGQKAKEAVLHYPGTWEPAEQNGRKVRAFHVQPITFIIEEEDDETPACCTGPDASNI